MLDVAIAWHTAWGKMAQLVTCWAANETSQSLKFYNYGEDLC